MKHTNVLRSTKGFTLVELAIVLVIIGLIIGGVLKGRELIFNAKAKNVGLQLTSIASAAPLYRDKNPSVPFTQISTARLSSAGFLTGVGGSVNRYGGLVSIAQATATTPLAVVSLNVPGDVAKMVDDLLDDGNPSTGSIRIFPVPAVQILSKIYPTGTAFADAAALLVDPIPETNIALTFSY